MLSIKHVAEDGSERIEQADSVEYNAQKWVLVGLDANGRPNGVEFKGGHAFVMNDAGKTVGVYNLNKQKDRN